LLVSWRCVARHPVLQCLIMLWNIAIVYLCSVIPLWNISMLYCCHVALLPLLPLRTSRFHLAVHLYVDKRIYPHSIHAPQLHQSSVYHPSLLKAKLSPCRLESLIHLDSRFYHSSLLQAKSSPRRLESLIHLDTPFYHLDSAEKKRQCKGSRGQEERISL
jgi:hypothetical protein